MRHFFTEISNSPTLWFKRRLTYTRSVAVTSMVGHVLGLGDRHGSNILLDFMTGSVVHIDLGISFDQGRMLPVPELVPFRMTRNIVDGMGASGTQGVFQRCAEETLRVLREGTEVITTVLEVFRHDPLHSWCVFYAYLHVIHSYRSTSEAKLQRVQGVNAASTPGELNLSSGYAEEAADRAVSGVVRKLDKSLSVEYTVNDLIAQATDVNNLAVIYHGWRPLL